jgi:hypothetical protein
VALAVLWLQTALKNEKSGAARADFNPRGQHGADWVGQLAVI